MKVNGVRQVVGIVPYLHDAKKIVLLKSRRHDDRWVFPKGGWEHGESQEQGALREAWEEGGIRGLVVEPIGEYMDYKKDGTVKGNFTYFLVRVTELEKDWPEMDQRERLEV